jgi:hypothetical protein
MYDKILRKDAIDEYFCKDFEAEFDAQISANIMDFKKRAKKLCKTVIEKRNSGALSNKDINSGFIYALSKGFIGVEGYFDMIPIDINNLVESQWNSLCLDEEAFIMGTNQIVGKLHFDRDMTCVNNTSFSKNPFSVLVDWYNRQEFGNRNADELTKYIPMSVCDRTDASIFPYSYSLPKIENASNTFTNGKIGVGSYTKAGIDMKGNLAESKNHFKAYQQISYDCKEHEPQVSWAINPSVKYIEVTTHLDENVLYNHYIDCLIAGSDRNLFRYESIHEFVISIFEVILLKIEKMEENGDNVLTFIGQNNCTYNLYYHFYDSLKKIVMSSKINSINKLYINIGSYGVQEYIRTNLRQYFKKQMVLNEETYYFLNNERMRKQVPDHSKADIGKRWANGCMVYEGLFGHLFDDIIVSIMNRKEIVKFSNKKQENIFQITTASAITYAIMYGSFATCGCVEEGGLYNDNSDYNKTLNDPLSGIIVTDDNFKCEIIKTISNVMKACFDIMIGAFIMKYLRDILKRNKMGKDFSNADTRYVRDLMEKAFDLTHHELMDDIAVYSKGNRGPQLCGSSSNTISYYVEKNAIEEALDHETIIKNYILMRLSNIPTLSLMTRSILDIANSYTEKKKYEQDISGANKFGGDQSGLYPHYTTGNFERGQEEVKTPFDDLLPYDDGNMVEEFEKAYNLDTDIDSYAENIISEFETASECFDYTGMNEASKKLACAMKYMDKYDANIQTKLENIFNKFISSNIFTDKIDCENEPHYSAKHRFFHSPLKYINYANIV